MSLPNVPKPVPDATPLVAPEDCPHVTWVPFQKQWVAPDAMSQELYTSAWCPSCLMQRIGPKVTV